MIRSDRTVLGLDTSTEHAICFVGDENGHVYGAGVERHERNLSGRLYPLIEGVLKHCGLTLGDVDIFAVGVGPGSFTGVRIGVTTMRTIAQVRSKHLVGVGTLDMLARSAAEQLVSTRPEYCVVLPSRRSEVYAACYRGQERTREPFTASYEQALRLVPGAVIAAPAALIELLQPAHPILIESPDPAHFAALAAAEIAAERYHRPDSLEPMYVAAAAVSLHKLH